MQNGATHATTDAADSNAAIPQFSAVFAFRIELKAFESCSGSEQPARLAVTDAKPQHAAISTLTIWPGDCPVKPVCIWTAQPKRRTRRRDPSLCR